MLCELVTQKLPYQDLYLTPIQIGRGVADEELQPALPKGSNPGLATIVSLCVDFSQDMRLDFEQIVEELRPVVDGIERQERRQSSGGSSGFLGRLLGY